MSRPIDSTKSQVGSLIFIGDCPIHSESEIAPAPMKVRVRKLHPAAILPTYATGGSGCFDLYAATHDAGIGHRDGVRVFPGAPVNFGTGLSFEVPAGHVMLVFSRSGHGFKNDTRLANCAGVIDSDYRGEVAVKLTCDDNEDCNVLSVQQGDRIAQALIIPYPRIEFTEVDELSGTERGAGGFGSTGR